MPNYIANKLVVSADNAERLNEFLAFIKSYDKTIIDFNKIIPMPQCLQNTEESGNTDDAIYYYLSQVDKLELIKEVIRFPLSEKRINDIKNYTDERKEELFNIGKQYFNIWEQTGYATWYRWRIANWGTKWNAFEDYIESIDDNNVVIFFQTAWNGVEKVIEKLVSKFNDLHFEYKYADEDFSYNTGIGDSSDGQLYMSYPNGGSNCDDAIAIYIECWRHDEDDFYKDDDGHWHNKDWEDDEEE